MPEASGPRSRGRRTDLIYHIRKQALHLIILQPPLLRLTAQPNRSPKLRYGDPRPPYWWCAFLFGRLEPSGEEDFPQ